MSVSALCERRKPPWLNEHIQCQRPDAATASAIRARKWAAMHQVHVISIAMLSMDSTTEREKSKRGECCVLEAGWECAGTSNRRTQSELFNAVINWLFYLTSRCSSCLRCLQYKYRSFKVLPANDSSNNNSRAKFWKVAKQGEAWH